MDRTVQETFNTFWMMRWGKEQKNIDYRIMSFLCKAEHDGDLKDILKDIISGFKLWLEKEDEFRQADWEQMSDVANELHKKYIYHDQAFPIIAEVYMYIDRRETKKHGQNGSADH